MTGFGIATDSNSKYKITIEIKSVNSKFLELNIKLPKGYSEKEIFKRIGSSQIKLGRTFINNSCYAKQE